MSLHISFHISWIAFAAGAILIGLIAQALEGFWREARRLLSSSRPGAPDRSPHNPQPADEERLEHPRAIDFAFPAQGRRRAQERPRGASQGGTE